MENVMIMNGFSELSQNEMDIIDGGKSFSMYDFSTSVVVGAITGTTAGAVGSLWTGPGVGAGAAGGFCVGVLTGAIEYIVSCVFD